MFVPEQLARNAPSWWGPEGTAWLDLLPQRVAQLERRWSLQVGRAFEPGGATSFVAPVIQLDGTPAVLKVAVPDRESAHEAAALQLYDGEGAVRLIAVDTEHHAMLLERCTPGASLLGAARDGQDVLNTAVPILRRLWRPVPPGDPFERLADVAAEWAVLVEQRFRRYAEPYDPRLVARGVDLLRQLPADRQPQVLLHRDFHPGNVLAATREPWLAIDPKPLVGDPAYDAVPLLLQAGPTLEAPDPSRTVSRRLEHLAGALGVDAKRVAGWGVARSVEDALWYLTVDDPPAGAESMAVASLLDRLSR